MDAPHMAKKQQQWLFTGAKSAAMVKFEKHDKNENRVAFILTEAETGAPCGSSTTAPPNVAGDGKVMCQDRKQQTCVSGPSKNMEARPLVF